MYVHIYCTYIPKNPHSLCPFPFPSQSSPPAPKPNLGQSFSWRRKVTINPSSATHLFPPPASGGDIRNRPEKSKEGGAPRRCPNFVTLLASSPPRDAGHPARLLSRRKGKDLNSRSIRNVPRRIFYRLHYLFASVFPKN